MQERIEQIKDELTTATDISHIKFRQGYIQALRDSLEVDMQENA